jgi:hypothetical protein
MVPVNAEPPTDSNSESSAIVVRTELEGSYTCTDRVTYAMIVITGSGESSLHEIPAHPALLSSVRATSERCGILTLVSSDITRRVQFTSRTASVAIFLLSTSYPLSPHQHSRLTEVFSYFCTRVPLICSRFACGYCMQRRLNARPLFIAHQLHTQENSIPSLVPAGTVALVRSVVAHHGIRRPSASYR